jgi:hypothetical protein
MAVGFAAIRVDDSTALSSRNSTTLLHCCSAAFRVSLIRFPGMGLDLHQQGRKKPEVE